MRLSLSLFLAIPLIAETPPAGDWKGTLPAGDLRLLLHVRRADSGEYTGTLDSPDQNATIPASKVEVKGDLFRAEFEKVGAVFEARLPAAGKAMSGTFTQRGNAMPLTFRPVTGDPPNPADAPLQASRPLDIRLPNGPAIFPNGG